MIRPTHRPQARPLWQGNDWLDLVGVLLVVGWLWLLGLAFWWAVLA